MKASRLLFEVWPYVALAVFAGGLTVRLAQLGRRSPPSPYELRRARVEFWGGDSLWRLWRLALGLLVAAHLVGLAVPRAVLAWNAAPGRLYVVEGLGLVAGVTAALGWARLIARYLERPARAVLTELGDSIFFSLTFVALASGVVTAARYRWASSWGAATLAPYAASLLRGRPSAALVEHLPFVVQLHVVASATALAAAPFSRLALFPGVALSRAAALAAAARAGASARVGAWWRQRHRLTWLWPEEELRWLDEPPRAEGAPLAADGPRPRPARREVDGRLYESGS